MHFAIITAGGTGERMGTDSPKQFIKIGSKPVIIHSIEKFLDFNPEVKIVLTLPEKYFPVWEKIKSDFFPELQITHVKGGATRFKSIQNALSCINETEGLVAIHDAVRPFVSKKIIAECYKMAAEKGSGVAAIELRDSIREIVGNKSVTRDRSKFRLMQTPQTFDLGKIKEVYMNVSDLSFTDDASVWENAGYEVKLVEGSRLNIKITYPEDIELAESILGN